MVYLCQVGQNLAMSIEEKCSQGFFIDINDHVDLENYVMHGHQNIIIF